MPKIFYLPDLFKFFEKTNYFQGTANKFDEFHKKIKIFYNNLDGQNFERSKSGTSGFTFPVGPTETDILDFIRTKQDITSIFFIFNDLMKGKREENFISEFDSEIKLIFW